METEVTVYEGEGVATMPLPPQDDSGLGDVTRLTPTRLALVQPMTVDNQGAKTGQLLDTGTGLAYDEMQVVPFKFWRSRAFFPPGAPATKGSEPLCRSNNAIVPTEDSKVKQASSCENCPRSKWVGNGKSPDCREKIEMLVVNTETDMLHFISAGGKSFVPIRTKLSGLQSIINQEEKKGNTAHTYEYAMTIGSQKDDKTPNFKLVIKSITKLADDARKWYGNMYNSMRQQAEAAKQAAINEANAEASVGEVLEGEIVQEV